MDLLNSHEQQLKDVNDFDTLRLKKESDIRMGTSCSLTDNLDFNEDDLYLPAELSVAEITQQIDAELGLTEDHFSRPEGYFCFSSSEEMEMAIDRCKEMIQAPDTDHDKKKYLFSKLIQLKLKLQNIEDAPDKASDFKVVLGHNFEIRSLERPQQYCEKCCGIIWGVMTSWYRCVDCGFKCHSKCLNLITRRCARSKMLENCSYELAICPEIGLSQQKFRCAECKKKFVFKSDACLPRQCEYTGLFYCSHCHWNSQIIIPARVVHNWDFTTYKVCRASIQFLRLMVRKPVLNMESLNPTLFALVTDLGHVKKLRNDILLMKKYFLTCHAALQEKLLLQLKDRQHFVEGADIYSLQDLVDVFSGTLVNYLEKIHSSFVAHIKEKCQGCRGKGFICELCKSEDVLFPFEPRTEICSSCSSVFHQDCYFMHEGSCPKCARRKKSTEAVAT